MKILLLLGGALILASALLRRQLPRDIRNNNPGNIRRNNIQWEGMQAVQNDRDFVQFKSPEYGFRAMARILRTYESRGIVTVRDIINTYAPTEENNTENYINFVAQNLNSSSDAEINLNTRLFDLIKSMTIFENGMLYANFYDDSTISEGISLALT